MFDAHFKEWISYIPENGLNIQIGKNLDIYLPKNELVNVYFYAPTETKS